MRVFRLAIVGAGPYGTYAMERLAASVAVHTLRPRLEIHVYEQTGEFGAGQVHSARQVTTSYLNRIAGELSFAADETVEGAGPLLGADQRPTLYEWCRRRYAETGDKQFAINPDTYPRRYLHGMALHDAFYRYVKTLREIPDTSVHLHSSEVTDVVDIGDALRISAIGSGDGVLANSILFVTGHSYNDPARYPARRAWTQMADGAGVAYLPTAYPLATRLSPDAMPPGRVVGVAGTMLTGIDAILHLTEGRGGRFVRDGDGLSYLPSGREPAAIVAFSGSGLFCFARATSVAKAKHHGAFLTTQTVDRLRHLHGAPLGARRQLDYERHLLPLIVLEMAVLYYSTMLGREFGASLAAGARPAFEAFLTEGAGKMPPEESLPLLLQPVEEGVAAEVAPPERFSWLRAIRPIQGEALASPQAYTAALLEFMTADIAAAREGIPVNPTKTAADGVWRGLRPVIVYAVNDGGLSASSHRTFLQSWLRHHNRLAYGAPPEVMEKLVAVIRHGVVDMSTGPDARLEMHGGGLFVVGPLTGARRRIDTLVDARVHQFNAAADASRLYPNLLRRKLVRQWRNPGPDGDGYCPGGLDLTDDFHPVTEGGGVDRRLTFLGPSIEGRKFFQGGAMKPHANHHAMRNVVTWLASFWAAAAP